MGGGGGGEHGHGHGGEGGDFRKKVWSMTGGPYCRPKHWRRNTAIAMAGIFLICVPIAMKSAELERYFNRRQALSRDRSDQNADDSSPQHIVLAQMEANRSCRLLRRPDPLAIITRWVQTIAQNA